MLFADWHKQILLSKVRQMRRVVCITLPFIGIPGLIEDVFPLADISYLSLIPRPGTASPPLSTVARQLYDIPLLSLHTGLVSAYWSTSRVWEPWRFLESDFGVLLQYGFSFSRGDIDGYWNVVKSAASQFSDAVLKAARNVDAQAIAVYGRGHWTMNAGALAAQKLNLPLLVIERGILPNSYIVDLTVPFTAPGSHFRTAWEDFRSRVDWSSKGTRQLSESRWELYERLLSGSGAIANGRDRKQHLIVGQCLFDYNCLNAPFRSPKDFIEYVLSRYPNLQGSHDVSYRPHPLSPEEYDGKVVRTKFGPIELDRSAPWEKWTSDMTLYTWNSTLGLEARMIFGLDVRILDSSCHYLWTTEAVDGDKKLYLDFLNEYSVLQ